jgi:hypothetical protein
MTSRELTKPEKKKLRQLAREAYTRELDLLLRDLDQAFADWREKRIDGFRLSELIHEFHQGAARDLYSQYDRLKPRLLVAGAIARGILEPGEVPDDLITVLQPAIDTLRRLDDEEDE